MSTAGTPRGMRFKVYQASWDQVDHRLRFGIHSQMNDGTLPSPGPSGEPIDHPVEIARGTSRCPHVLASVCAVAWYLH